MNGMTSFDLLAQQKMEGCFLPSQEITSVDRLSLRSWWMVFKAPEFSYVENSFPSHLTVLFFFFYIRACLQVDTGSCICNCNCQYQALHKYPCEMVLDTVYSLAGNRLDTPVSQAAKCITINLLSLCCGIGNL